MRQARGEKPTEDTAADAAQESLSVEDVFESKELAQAATEDLTEGTDDSDEATETAS